MDKRFGFVRVGACVPELKVSDIPFNIEKIKESINEAVKNNIEITVFPELAITSYTAADLFHNTLLIEEAKKGLIGLTEFTKNKQGVFIIGVPLVKDNQLFNCAAVIENGNILGIVPKTYIPNYGEFYEKRWFSEANSSLSDKIIIDHQEVPFKTNILFQKSDLENVSFGVEICEDLWCTYPPSNEHTIAGATMIFNLSASNEIIGKKEYREKLVKMQSEKTLSAYIYASSGANESTTDLVFSGASLIVENGHVLNKNKRFDFASNLVFSEVDVFRLNNMRIKDISYMGVRKENHPYEIVKYNGLDSLDKLTRTYDAYPFVPSSIQTRNTRCEEILLIQAMGLAKRLKATGIKRCVMGISGGLDSTLAFLVTIKAYDILKLDKKDIIGITLPGFGTTTRTYENAIKLVNSYGATLKEISIKDACLQHFKDIDHDLENYDVTYENVQARERTQILMDYANKVGALVVGTGDLSELALGWCTYNGDHMSMYAVNTSIPKTLVRYLVDYYADNENNETAKTNLKDILATPVSPELLPPSKSGEILQITENTIGPYALHDFFIYHFLRYGAEPMKLFYLAKETFADTDRKTIKKWLLVFLKRFFSQQFKRSCIPDGPKVGTISLSPRGDLRMPSDASVAMWIREVESIGSEDEK